VTADQAKTAATGWLSDGRLPLEKAAGLQLKRVETFKDSEGGPLYHVIYLDPQGFVIMAADDLIEPIIGFAPNGEFDPSCENPLGALVSRDLPDRMAKVKDPDTDRSQGALLAARNKWTSLANGPVVDNGLDSITTVRIPPLTQTRWDQSTAAGYACYNYYTPPNASGSTMNYVCGCTATAMAQLMRFWNYPTNGVGTASYTITVNGITKSLVQTVTHGVSYYQDSLIVNAGDPVAFSATNLGGIAGGLALFNTYFVINPTETTFQVSATPGGPPINFTSAGSGITFTPGILLPAGINLGTRGILSGATAAGQQVIAGTGALTLPSTTSGNLHITVGSNTFSGATPNSPVVISAPITDNGSGVLTLVKNGSGNLALRGTNTFTGGIVVNGGNLIWLTDANLGAPDKPVTIAASTGLAGNTNIGAATSNRPFILNEGVIATFASGGSGSNTLNGPVQGPGGIAIYHGNAGSATANLNNAANTFTGPIRYQGTNVGLTLNINSLADPVGAGNITFGHLLGGAQTMAFNLGATATAPMTLNNRQFELGVGPQVLQAIGNASTQALTINSNLLDNSPAIARTLTLQGNGTGLSTFAGNIVQAASTLGIIKAGTGTWVLSGINEYSGPTTINAGTLLVNGALNATIAVTVNSATLGGTGSIGAPVIVAAAGSIAPGASAGTLSIGGDLDLSAMAGGAGKLKFELGTLAGPNDRIAVTGTMTIGAGALGFNNFDFTNLGGLQTGTYTLVTCGGINAGDTLDAADLAGVIGTATATLGISSNNIVLNVVSGASGYPAWQSANATDQSINLDHDNDGVSNGIEFFLGGPVNTTGPNPAPLPGVANAGGILSVTWTRAAGYLGAYGTDFTVETSSSLSGVWVAETVGASVTISGNDVKYTFPAGTKNFARLKVTGP